MNPDNHNLPDEVAAYLAKVNTAGAFQSATITTEVKPAAAHKGRSLTKITSAVIRTGIQYKNLAVNEGEDTGDLPWGEWAVYPYLIAHKGEWYARLYLKEDAPLRVTYFVDGAEVGRDEFLSYLTPSAAKRKAPKGGTITPRLASVALR